MADSRTIDGSTRVSIPLVVGIVTFVFAAGAAHWRLQSLDSEFREFRSAAAQKFDEGIKKSHDLELRQTAVEGDIRRMADSIQSIDRKLDRVIRREADDGR